MDKGKLYIVPTPIGNLEDITLRALNVLKEVDSILAEDTRTSSVLLKHYEITKPLKSYHIHNEHKVLAPIIERINEGENIALVSDAGTPAISDPGYLLVRECLANEIEVEALPGATAFVPALIKSGFPTDRFVFEGFLPHKKGRQTRIKEIAEEKRTVILYESPHRINKAVEQFKEFMGEDRYISISRELTKLYEETITGTVEEVLVAITERKIKGEMVVVVAGKDYKPV
ncbi:16S rRNA (cytidine(1402)-2'-O)-methyltransferase [Aureibacter tunicatorum]|uniref:Ribosomal RNA small subunit methyltransferase I n=1 Tax=Aureibacter tunicatorum TaxID=866807 RepID=A0AAE4BR85_9BACT|nr:16S rRNA (cytidine(1402)-2'-O)-methyltransferase [Aureibacter tunicatorum]MDR6237505.1 16S rRNA (cytidine1402-2'-O)-methyltransferase [Aureibacter tunicatorum]BDD02539.1 ribosomal RNA small subunit methyltransferase I [Aureibacter tunicatorum]